MTKLVFVLWSLGVTVSTGHDTAPRDWWHPTGIYNTFKDCKTFAGNNPKYAWRMICLRMRYDKALVALPQKDQPR